MAGYVGSQGTPATDCYIEQTSKEEMRISRSVATETVFLMRNQMNYSTAKKMQTLLDKEGMTAADAEGDERFRKILRDREAEKKANMEEFKLAKGRDVRYGAIIQLQHGISQKYIKVSREAADQAEGRKVCLDREAAEAAWFRVLPRLRVHSEGER
eukprot:719468-Prymnesium_polylepis.1